MSLFFPEILVYTDGDMGASEKCVGMAVSSLKKAVADLKLPFHIRYTDRKELLDSRWCSSCQLLVMPGGRDLPYCHALEGVGNHTIKNFVNSGGSYLGICAGAYYGSAYVEFNEHDPKMSVVGSRELAFFPVTAAGPVFPGFSYTTNAGARVASVSVTHKGHAVLGKHVGEASLFYNGGCYFKERERIGGEILTAITLAKYASHSSSTGPPAVSTSECPAIIGGRVGRGKVVLTGVHFEASLHLLSTYYTNDNHISPLLPSLLTAESQRDELFRTCVQYLLSSAAEHRNC